MSARDIYLKVLFGLLRVTGPLSLFLAYQAAIIYSQTESGKQGVAGLAVAAFGVAGVAATWLFLLLPVAEWLGSRKPS